MAEKLAHMVSVTEALNEKISMAQEDLAGYQRDLEEMDRRNARRTIVGWFKALVGIPLLLVGFLSITVGILGGSSGFLVFGAAVVVLAFAIALSGDKKEDTTKLEHLIVEAERKVQKHTQEKRELLLAHERVIREIDGAKVTSRMDLASVANEKECPMCAEMVKSRAKVCRFCSYQFQPKGDS